MTDFVFADRYAEAGLAPTSQMINSRKASADRIVADATNANILDLVGVYYGNPGLSLTWLRDQFGAEDPTFSLVNNERETRVLAAAILGARVADGRAQTILAVVTGNVAGRNPPTVAQWLLGDAIEALGRLAVAERKPAAIETKIVPTVTAQLAEEVAAVADSDWPALLAVLAKMRTESQSSATMTAAQAAAALAALNRQVRLQREESQMLWWLVGGHSRSLGTAFSSLGPQQAAIVGAIDLAALTTVTYLGPVAAPAMLERVVALAKRPEGAGQRDLVGAIDGLAPEDIARLEIRPDAVPARLAPVTSALALAKSIGQGAWHVRFHDTTGLEATTVFEPCDLATQLYREQLLGQLL